MDVEAALPAIPSLPNALIAGVIIRLVKLKLTPDITDGIPYFMVFRNTERLKENFKG